ncbi:hypothetical protein [Rhizobium tropici]|uniref:hypothetical protein n=1 Tax=Rhizobium tropici TaxID=398 RepID=UPI0015ECC819|nr:hypothetical protein [Rhizobium tropici]
MLADQANNTLHAERAVTMSNFRAIQASTHAGVVPTLFAPGTLQIYSAAHPTAVKQ